MTRVTAVLTLLTLIALLTLLTADAALSQRLTGNMTGRVVDWNGEPLQGAVVTITSPVLITGSQTAAGDDRGDFRFRRLEPGVYEVRGDLAGFGTMLRQNVRVAIGATTELTLELQSEVGEVLVVTAEPPTVDTISTKSGVNFTREVLENLPTRSIGTVFNYTPGVTGSSARGSTVRGNAWRLDGVDITDPTVGTQLVSFNHDTIEEIQVQTGGHPAEYGQATGAIVNVVTKSGGNTLSGEGNLYLENDTLTSTNGQAITERFPNLTPGTLLRSVDTQFQLGGPVARNRVWFFGAYRYVDRDSEVVGFVDSLGHPVPTNRNEDFAFGKVTAQLTPDHKVVAGLSYNSLTLDNRGASSQTRPVATSDQRGADRVPNVTWTGLLGTTTTAQVRFTLVDSYFDVVPKNNEPGCFNQDVLIQGCSAGREDLNERNRRQLMASLSHFRKLGGTHDLKVGIDLEASDNFRDLNINQGRINLTLDDGAGGDVPFLVQTTQASPSDEAVVRLSVYAQDSWGVTDRLTLNLGVRIDSNEGVFPEQTLASGETQAEVRDIVSSTDVSPRVGVAYALGGLGRSVIQVSYSRYVESLITQNFSNVNGNAPASQLRAACGGQLGFLCTPGDGDYSSMILAESGSLNAELDDDLRIAKTDELAVGFEMALGSAMSFAVQYVNKDEFDLIEDVELRDFIPRTAHHPGDTELDDAGIVVDEIPSQTVTVYDPDLNSPSMFLITNPDLARRAYRGIEFVFNRRMSNRWWLQSSLVISESTGLVGTGFSDSPSISGLFDSPNSLINAEGRLTRNRTYQLKTLGTYRAPWGISATGYYRWLSGRPYNRTVRFTRYDSNGDGTNDTLFDGGPIVINAEPRGARDQDDLHVFDMRLEKTLELPQGRLGVMFDAFNFFNISTVFTRRTRSTSSTNFGDPLSFHSPRQLRFGVRFVF